MRIQSNLKGGEIFKGIVLAHVILVLHLIIIAALGVIVLILGGLGRNLLWFFIGGAAVVILSAVFVYRRMKKSGKHAMVEMEQMALLRDRDVEIRFLGGLVSFSLKQTRAAGEISAGSAENRLQIEDPTARQARDLTELANLLEKNILTPDEYRKAKQRLIKPS